MKVLSYKCMQAIRVKLNDVVNSGAISHPLSPQVVVAPIQPLLAMTRQDSWNDHPPTTTFTPKVKGKQAGCSCAGCFLPPEVVSDSCPRVIADFSLITAQVSWLNLVCFGHSHRKLELENKHQRFKLTGQRTWGQIINQGFYTEQWYRSVYSAFAWSWDLTLCTMWIAILWKGLFELLHTNEAVV